MKKKRRRKSAAREARDRRRLVGIVILAVVFLALIGVIAGTRLGASRREALEAEAQAEQDRAAKEEEAARLKEEEEQQKKAEAEEKEAAKAADQAERDKTRELLLEQSRRANEENAAVIRKIAGLGVPNVGAYAEATAITPEEIAPHTVCIDAGHQAAEMADREPVGPGAEATKKRGTPGSVGAATGQPEYDLTLQIALKLQGVLTSRGYNVVMTRTANDAALSNIDRANIGNSSGSEIIVKINAYGGDPGGSGAQAFAPADDNPYLDAGLIGADRHLTQVILDNFCATTGAANLGVRLQNDQVTTNWSQIPAASISVGYLSNPGEDTLMAREDYRALMAAGIANGIDAYFAGQ